MTRWAPVSLLVLLQATALVFSSVDKGPSLQSVHHAGYQIIFERDDFSITTEQTRDTTVAADENQHKPTLTVEQQKKIKSRMSVAYLCNNNNAESPHATAALQSTTTTVADNTQVIDANSLLSNFGKTQETTPGLKQKKRKRFSSRQTRRPYSRRGPVSGSNAAQTTSLTNPTPSTTPTNPPTAQPLAIQPRPRQQRDFSARNPNINHHWLQSFALHPTWKALLLRNLKTMVSADDMASLFSAVGLLLENMVAFEETLTDVFSYLLTNVHFEVYTKLCKAYSIHLSTLLPIVSLNLTTISSESFVTMFKWLYAELPHFALQVYDTVAMEHIVHWEEQKVSQLLNELCLPSTHDILREVLVVSFTKAHAPHLALQAAKSIADVERRDQLMSSVVYYVSLNDCHPCLYHYWAYSPAKKLGFANVPEMIRNIYGKYVKLSPPAIGAQTYHTTNALCAPLETGYDLPSDTRLAIDNDDVDSYTASLGPSVLWSNPLLEQHATYAVSRGSIEILAHLFTSYQTIQLSESVRIAKDMFLHSLKLENKIRAVPTNRFTDQPLEWLLVDLHDSNAWSFCFKDAVQWAAEEVQTERTDLKPQLYVLMQRNPSLLQTLGEATYASRKAALEDLLNDYHRSTARYAASLRSTH